MTKLAAVMARAAKSAATDSAASDRELLRRYAASGDESAFATVVSRHTGMVLGVCRRVLHNPADAEDACQAVFLVLARKVKAVRWQASAANWLFATARKVSQSARRGAVRRAKHEGAAVVPEATSPTDAMTARELQAALDEELDRLPPRYREPLVLCYLEGLTRDEAAARLGVPEATLKSQLERGRKKLADALTARGCGLGVALLAAAATSPAGASPPRLLQSILAAAGGSPSAPVAALAREVAVNTWVRAVALSAAVLAVVGVGLGVARPGGTDQPAMKKGSSPGAAAPAAGKAQTATGVVVGPDGKPVAGAKVWHGSGTGYLGGTLPPPTPVATTGPDGTFKVDVPPDTGLGTLVATKDGSGIGFEAPGPRRNERRAITLRLVPDDIPVRGRVLNLQGQPVAGAAVVVKGVYGGKGDKTDEWEAVARRSTDEAGIRFHELFPASVSLSEGPVGGVTCEAKTDADGNFRLTGFGRDRLIELRVSGPGITTTDIKVVTRDMKTIVTPDDKLPSQHTAQTYYGATFQWAAAPCQPFRGRVTDRATGRPVAGVVVRRTGWGHPAQATTDADGRYALDGLPPGEHELLFVPPIESPYFIRRVTAGRAVNLRPVTADTELYSGVWVTGTVRDAKTGRPAEVPLIYRPAGDNAAVEKIPGFVPRGLFEFGRYASGPDGRYKALAPPGKGYLMVQAAGGEYMKADYADWQGDMAKPDPEQFVPSAPVELASNLTAVCAITVPADKPAAEYPIKLDPGETIRCRVTDPDGKPLAGAFAGPRESWLVWTGKPLAGAEFDLKNINPNRPRSVYVYHPGKKLGTTFTPKGVGPLEIRLKPVGTATGRLLDDDGRPRANVPIEVGGSHDDADLAVCIRRLHPATATDAAGRFAVPGLVEGMTYHLRWRGTSPKGGVESRFQKFSVAAGETKDLGDVGGKKGDD